MSQNPTFESLLSKLDNKMTSCSHKLNWLTIGNSKLGINIAHFSLPSQKTKSGKVVCPFAGDCKRFCYAKKGNFKFKNVTTKYERNYVESKCDTFIESIQSDINKLTGMVEFIRIHTSGDFYSMDYLDKWISIAQQNPTRIFYAYTKSVSFFSNVKLPDNFRIIFSEGGKHDHMIGARTRATIFQKMENIPQGYLDCSENDLQAVKATYTNKNVALKLH